LYFETARRNGRTLAIGVLAAVILASLWFAPPPVSGTGDELGYQRAAVHWLRSGVISTAPTAGAPLADAYREPAYPFLLACWWRAAGAGVPPAAEERVAEPAWRVVPGVRALGVGALAVSALAAGLAARAARAGAAWSLTATALVLASPALRHAALTLGPEALAAALVSLAGWGLVRAAAGGGGAAAALAGAAVGLGVLARAGGVALVPAGAAVLLAFPSSASLRARAGRSALFLLLALLPGALWATRNLGATGHAVLADRGGQVLWTRAELDRQIAREGFLPAFLSWTPLEPARSIAERRWPEATYGRYEWSGPGNFFTRSIRRWRADRELGGDALAADRALGRAALREFLARPLDHALAGVAVAWRGLFAERSPALLAPLDLRFVLGVLPMAGVFLLAAAALRRRDGPAIALVAAPLALFVFHAALTEFLPRFSIPGLPLAWAALAVLLARLRPAREGGASRSAAGHRAAAENAAPRAA
jgi:hypothetical protein